MKIYIGLLTLCVFHPNVWGTTAFVAHGPKSLTFKGHKTSSTQPYAQLSQSFSYLGGLNGDGSQKASGAQGAGVVLKDANVSEMATASLKYATDSRMTVKGSSSYNSTSASGMQAAKNIWDTLAPVTVQGGSLRTWSVANPAVERVQVLLKSDGRPLNANIELWHGPDNTPQKMGVYIEDGNLRPLSVIMETPRGHNAIAIRNTGPIEFPLSACCVEAEVDGPKGSSGLAAVNKKLSEMGASRTVQGGAVQTFPFSPSVASVQVLLKTDGRPLNARIELLQGPNNNKQVFEIYTEDGKERPFFAIIETPGTGNVVRIINTATVEFPLYANVEPYMVESTPNDGGWDKSSIGGWDKGGSSESSNAYYR